MEKPFEHYKNTIFKTGFLIILCFIFYGNTVQNDYTLDDSVAINLNHFTTRGIGGIPDIFKYDSNAGFYGPNVKQFAGGRYRPLSLTTYAIEYHLFGENPHISHYINILFFILTVLFLYVLLSKIFYSYDSKNDFLDLPFIITLLFIAHPIHTEVVANIKGRDEIMALAGSLSATFLILKYIDTEKRRYLIIGSFLFFLALLSKENSVTFLAVVPLTIFYYKNEKLHKYFYSILSLIVATLLYLVIRKAALSGTGPLYENLLSNPFLFATNSQKYATIFYTFGIYLKLLVFPQPLTFDYYPYHIKLLNWNNLIALISFVVHISLLIYALLNLSKKSIVSYGILFYLITFSIVSNFLFPICTFMSERFMFMPSVGFLIVISWIIFYKTPIIAESKYLKYSLLMIILVLCFIKTYNRNKVWKDNFTLYSTDVKTSKNSIKSNIGMANILLIKANQTNDSMMIKKYLADAIQYSTKAVLLYPDYFDAVLMLGSAYAANYEVENALFCYKRALELMPGNKLVFRLIEDIMSKTDNVDFKIGKYSEFIKQTPDNFDFNYQIGYLYGRYKNNFNVSVRFLQKAIELDPNNFDANKNLGIVFGLLDNYEKSSYYLNKAFDISPYNKSALKNLLTAYKSAGNQEILKKDILKKIWELKEN